MSTDHNFWTESRAENRGPSAYQPNTLPLGQTSLHLPFTPAYLSNISHPYSPARPLPSRLLKLPLYKYKLEGDRAFSHFGPSVWNSRSPYSRYAATVTTFRSALKTHFFSLYLRLTQHCSISYVRGGRGVMVVMCLCDCVCVWLGVYVSFLLCLFDFCTSNTSYYALCKALRAF